MSKSLRIRGLRVIFGTSRFLMYYSSELRHNHLMMNTALAQIEQLLACVTVSVLLLSAIVVWDVVIPHWNAKDAE